MILSDRLTNGNTVHYYYTSTSVGSSRFAGPSSGHFVFRFLTVLGGESRTGDCSYSEEPRSQAINLIVYQHFIEKYLRSCCKTVADLISFCCMRWPPNCELKELRVSIRIPFHARKVKDNRANVRVFSFRYTVLMPIVIGIWTVLINISRERIGDRVDISKPGSDKRLL